MLRPVFPHCLEKTCPARRAKSKMVKTWLMNYVTIRHNKAQIRVHTLNILGIFINLEF